MCKKKSYLFMEKSMDYNLWYHYVICYFTSYHSFIYSTSNSECQNCVMHQGNKEKILSVLLQTSFFGWDKRHLQNNRINNGKSWEVLRVQRKSPMAKLLVIFWNDCFTIIDLHICTPMIESMYENMYIIFTLSRLWPNF